MHIADHTLTRPRWEGAVNARHIVGQIYGMGRREWLTERGWRELEDDGVATVLDLRNLSEVGKRATDPVGEPSRDILIRHVPLEDPEHPEFHRVTVRGTLGSREPHIPYMHHPAAYREYVRLFAPHLTTALREIAVSPSGGVVIHCSAGRDRTSLVAAFLLDLAGERDAIAHAYEAGAHGINEYHRVRTVPHPFERYFEPKRFEVELADRLASLAAFVEQLDARDFLIKNGFTRDELAALERKVSMR